MTVKLKRVDRKLPEYTKIKNLYNSSFPVEERALFAMLMYKSRKNYVDFWAIYADGKWAGFAYAVSDRNVTYLFYFAIDKNQRGRGLGTAALKALLKKYKGRKFFLTLERLDKSADNYAERIRRRHFYENAGLTKLDCRVREGTVIYDVMGTGSNITADEYGRLMRKYMGIILVKLFKDSLIEQ
jgi:GNAT superfamily N-acetyltransferase